VVQAAGEIYTKLSQSNPHFKKMYESLTAFRSDAYLWFQVAEMGFDNFPMRMRART
jgi:TRAP-type mannitol/chloroaromatic compound transport system substrate-binding protein